MRIINDSDFEPPFANEQPKEEISDTYIPCTVYLSAENVEFLTQLLISYISDNAEFFTNDEWQETDEIFNILKAGIVPGKSA
ncbi:hypothetical protein [Adhaeribacter aquaticus]|uniref:hypothetical protein n=1 Tax=Adhaeribacter aquaticus TaxID=299567 RepID=UPI00041E7B5D|nr:hypothetical protein [Adhaeribacter aquaticus]